MQTVTIRYTVEGEEPRYAQWADFLDDNSASGELLPEDVKVLDCGHEVCIGGGAGPLVTIVRVDERRWCEVCSEEPGDERELAGGETRDEGHGTYWICGACLDNEPCVACGGGHRKGAACALRFCECCASYRATDGGEMRAEDTLGAYWICVECVAELRTVLRDQALASPLVGRLLRASEYAFALRLGAAHVVPIDVQVNRACGVQS